MDGFSPHPDTALFTGVDNLNSVYWIVKGDARIEFARKLLIAFLFWFVEQGIGVFIFYLG